ncbi:MAG TPA: 6-pyruvoyl-tetrahydropterin synthase-related protein [Acidimicrobiales bacterium]|nr:6-pyruvoyl-tetrahydropterin synthase-related protein [Acidimicrobiales bacterium]
MASMRRPTLPTVLSFLAVAGASLFILLQLQPGLLVTNTTPAGGDMGAHVWGPAYLRDHLLGSGRVTGWTPDWYAGFPAYHFYFPLPSLAIVALDVVLPYNVGFKLVTVSGLVSLPVAAWALGRLLRLPFPSPPAMAVATVLFVFDRFHTIWGGNAAATLAGEFAFSIGLSLALVFVGVAYRALETGRGRALAGALLAGTALCHLLPAAFATLAVVVLLLLRRPDRARWKLLAVVGGLGFLLSAFWLVPFLVRHLQGYSNDMGWERTQAYLENLLPWLRSDSADVGPAARHLKLTMPLALVGAGLGIFRRRRGTVALSLVAAACALAFVAIPDGAIWNARFLPFWYLTTYLVAATAVGELAVLGGEALIRAFDGAAEDVGEADGASELPPRRPVPNVPAIAAPLLLLLLVVVYVGRPLGVFRDGDIDLPGGWSLPFFRSSTAESNFVPGWAAWNYSGYERKPDHPEYEELVDTMARLGRDRGCGRAMWEYEPDLNRFGTPMALMLLPYWTDGCIGSMEGLFFESSATVPYHFLNQSELSRTPSRAMRGLPYRDLNVAAGVRHLQLMGVRYFLALHPDTQAQASVNPDLTLLATTSPRTLVSSGQSQQRFWQVYEVDDAPLVEPLDNMPVVVDEGAAGQDGWLDVAVDWYQDESRWAVPLAADGPGDWPTVADPAAALARPAPREPLRAVDVADVEVDNDSIRFTVDRPGVPVLVKTSYFPNWKADGADGPWRVTPNFMVVVPTEQSVELRYGWTAVDVVAWLLSLAGLAACVVIARSRPVSLPPSRRPRPRVDSAWVDPFAVPEAAGRPREPASAP